MSASLGQVTVKVNPDPAEWLDVFREFTRAASLLAAASDRLAEALAADQSKDTVVRDAAGRVVRVIKGH